MADNINVTQGTGTIIRTDDVGGVQFQVVKLDLGGNGVSVPLALGQAASASCIPVVLSVAQETLLTDIESAVDGLEGAFTTLNAKDFATQTTLAAVLAKIIAAPATEAKQDTGITALGTLNTSVGALGTTLTTIDGRVDGLEALVTSTNTKLDTLATKVDAVGTRAYGTGERVAVASTSAQSGAITGTEVLLHASTKCYVKSGSNPTAVANGDSIPLEAGEKFHMRITTGDKIAVLRDSADGFLHITPVV